MRICMCLVVGWYADMKGFGSCCCWRLGQDHHSIWTALASRRVTYITCHRLALMQVSVYVLSCYAIYLLSSGLIMVGYGTHGNYMLWKIYFTICALLRGRRDIFSLEIYLLCNAVILFPGNESPVPHHKKMLVLLRGTSH